MSETGLRDDALLQILPGRSLAFSPEWREDGLSVLFDRNSGDYWVVSALARKLVELLVQADRRSAAELERLAEQAFGDGDEGDPAPAAARVLEELLQLGILGSTPAVHSRAGSIP